MGHNSNTRQLRDYFFIFWAITIIVFGPIFEAKGRGSTGLKSLVKENYIYLDLLYGKSARLFFATKIKEQLKKINYESACLARMKKKKVSKVFAQGYCRYEKLILHNQYFFELVEKYKWVSYRQYFRQKYPKGVKIQRPFEERPFRKKTLYQECLLTPERRVLVEFEHASGWQERGLNEKLYKDPEKRKKLFSHAASCLHYAQVLYDIGIPRQADHLGELSYFHSHHLFKLAKEIDYPFSGYYLEEAEALHHKKTFFALYKEQAYSCLAKIEGLNFSKPSVFEKKTVEEANFCLFKSAVAQWSYVRKVNFFRQLQELGLDFDLKRDTRGILSVDEAWVRKIFKERNFSYGQRLRPLNPLVIQLEKFWREKKRHMGLTGYYLLGKISDELNYNISVLKGGETQKIIVEIKKCTSSRFENYFSGEDKSYRKYHDFFRGDNFSHIILHCLFQKTLNQLVDVDIEKIQYKVVKSSFMAGLESYPEWFHLKKKEEGVDPSNGETKIFRWKKAIKHFVESRELGTFLTIAKNQDRKGMMEWAHNLGRLTFFSLIDQRGSYGVLSEELDILKDVALEYSFEQRKGEKVKIIDLWKKKSHLYRSAFRGYTLYTWADQHRRFLEKIRLNFEKELKHKNQISTYAQRLAQGWDYLWGVRKDFRFYIENLKLISYNLFRSSEVLKDMTGEESKWKVLELTRIGKSEYDFLSLTRNRLKHLEKCFKRHISFGDLTFCPMKRPLFLKKYLPGSLEDRLMKYFQLGVFLRKTNISPWTAFYVFATGEKPDFTVYENDPIYFDSRKRVFNDLYKPNIINGNTSTGAFEKLNFSLHKDIDWYWGVGKSVSDYIIDATSPLKHVKKYAQELGAWMYNQVY